MTTEYDYETFMKKLWEDYIILNPDAQKIVDLLKERNETLQNDHIAFRTYDHPRINIDELAKPFKKYGYECKGHYSFDAKKLRARHYEHSDSTRPKIFISELRTADFSESLQSAVEDLVKQMPEPGDYPLALIGRPWNPSYKLYQSLLQESEYAAWVSAFGIRPNHFTVNLRLNSSGGEIKGSPDELLEQSSTLAPSIPVSFSDGTYDVPAAYYEFAKRYPDENGELFQGFIAKSADKIFESTDQKHKAD